MTEEQKHLRQTALELAALLNAPLTPDEWRKAREASAAIAQDVDMLANCTTNTPGELMTTQLTKPLRPHEGFRARRDSAWLDQSA